MRQSQKITIINIRRPAQQDINQELQWLGSSLGLFNLRDKDKSCFRIFIELVKSTKRDIPLSSDQLAFQLDLSRGTVVHHLHKLLDSGIVLSESSGYILRNTSLHELLDEVEEDVRRTFSDLRKVAEEIDKGLGL